MHHFIFALAISNISGVTFAVVTDCKMTCREREKEKRRKGERKKRKKEREREREREREN